MVVESRKTNTNSCKSSVLACSLTVALSFLLTVFALSFTSQLYRPSCCSSSSDHHYISTATSRDSNNSSFSSPSPALIVNHGSKQNLSSPLNHNTDYPSQPSISSPPPIDHHPKRNSSSSPPPPPLNRNISDPTQKSNENNSDTTRKPLRNSTFNQRINAFLNNKSCKYRFFMTWITPSTLLTSREILSISTLFTAHPDGCLVILSSSMDTPQGHKLLTHITNLGFRILTIPPDFLSLFKNTPALKWYTAITHRQISPGRIPIAQNLSNLLRLVALYKYGGIYLDTDFIILRNFSGLTNTIGAQSVHSNGKWMRLNNAILIFDKGHPILLKFIEEFVATFDGNTWGYNGPYMVSRVMEKVEHDGGGGVNGVTVLSPQAFYPIDWIKISTFFHKPNDKAHKRWIDARLARLRQGSYAIHLWNKQSRLLEIDEGSIIGRFVSESCSICRYTFSSL